MSSLGRLIKFERISLYVVEGHFMVFQANPYQH
jgi:hypothetical protein